jgi:hypothetical protein
MTSILADRDWEEIKQLNADYLASDQNSSVARYEQMLTPEFTASLPDYKLYGRPLRTLNGEVKHVRYTDDYLRGDGRCRNGLQ